MTTRKNNQNEHKKPTSRLTKAGLALLVMGGMGLTDLVGVTLTDNHKNNLPPLEKPAPNSFLAFNYSFEPNTSYIMKVRTVGELFDCFVLLPVGLTFLAMARDKRYNGNGDYLTRGANKN